MTARLRCGRSFFATILFWVFFQILCGCAGNTEIGNPEASSGLIALSDEAELNTYLRSQLRDDIAANASTPSQGDDDVSGGEAPGVEPPSASPAGPEPRNRVLVDGDTIYVADGDRVVILTADETGKPRFTAAAPVGGSLTALHLLGDRLVAVARSADAAETLPGFSAGIRTALRIIDVSNPAAPRLLREIAIEGEDAASVANGDRLYLVQRFRPNLPSFEGPNAGTGNSDVTAQESLDRLGTASLADLTPDFAIHDADGSLQASGSLLNPGDIFHPDPPAGGAMTVITAVDPWNPDDPLRSIALIGNVDAVYPTESSIYFTIVQACDETAPCEADNRTQTFFYRADIDGNAPRFTASGAVWGAVDGQESIRERDGAVWVLSADRIGSPSDSASRYSTRLFSFEERDGRLETLSSLESGLLSNPPRIRFFGARAYLYPDFGPNLSSETGEITLLDLSDPRAPRLGGRLSPEGTLREWTAPDENHLIGIGSGDSGPAGESTLHLFLADVSDIDFPNVTDRESRIIPEAEAGSSLEFSPPVLDLAGNLLAVPLAVADSNQGLPDRFGGAFLYRAAPAGLDFLGIVPIPNPALAASDSVWVLPRFIRGRIYLFHPGGLTHADPENIEKEPETLWFTGT